MASHAHDDAASPARDKRIFANLAQRFANKEVRGPARVMAVIALALIPVATIAAPFGTAQLPLLERLAFWAMLLGLHLLIWLAWVAATFRKPGDWKWAVPVGVVVANGPLPLLIWAALRLFGRNLGANWPVIWLQTFAIAAVVFIALIFIFRSQLGEQVDGGKGPLWRAGIHDRQALAAIISNDHYCRLLKLDGEDRMVHGRYVDFLGETEGLDGLELRRGSWISGAAVKAIERRDRSIYVTLVNGEEVRASDGGRKRMRERGWI
ncbi:hypothetical protein [Sphingomicrobium flavum]|uniref:hypothetical protein n=1 Tax=Sphingomicrobium flavum TaxID=1229164 RepID=UPI0021AD9D64|nr:hypothetical protein [Sphingomicrobium flavum]